MQPGPTLKRAREGTFRDRWDEFLARLRLSPAVVDSYVARWEYYVDEFCARYRLDEEQTARARKCLHRTQERANQYLSKNRQRFVSLQEAHTFGEIGTEEAKKRIATLREPVDDIFDNQLKPCLERIPTRKQREAVERRRKEGKGQWEEGLVEPWHKRLP